MFSLRNIQERTFRGAKNTSKEKMSLIKRRIKCAADKGDRSIVVSAENVNDHVLNYLLGLGFVIDKKYVSISITIIGEDGLPDEKIDTCYTISW